MAWRWAVVLSIRNLLGFTGSPSYLERMASGLGASIHEAFRETGSRFSRAGALNETHVFYDMTKIEGLACKTNSQSRQ